MSDAKKCDRCGAFYEQYKGMFMLLEQKGIGHFKDLCPVCNDSLESWFFTLRPKEAADEPKEIGGEK